LLIEHGANQTLRNFQKAQLPKEVGTVFRETKHYENSKKLPSIRGAEEATKSIDAEECAEEYAYDEVAENSDDFTNWPDQRGQAAQEDYPSVTPSSDWATGTGNDSSNRSDQHSQAAQEDHPSSSKESAAPRAIIRVAATQRNPPVRLAPRALPFCTASPTTIIIRKAPSGVRRPPPNLPHPDDLAAAEALVAKAAQSKGPAASTDTDVQPRDDFCDPGVREKSVSSLTAVTPTTPLGPQMALTEAMISGDYVAMGRALQVGMLLVAHFPVESFRITSLCLFLRCQQSLKC
jgi:hypothetical protein